LLMERDSHGNLQVSQIPTEKLLNHMCKDRIHHVKSNIHKYYPDFTPEEEYNVKSFKFAINEHFFGYDGRGGFPTKFDMSYGFNLGANAVSLVLAGISGCMSTVSQLDKGGQPWAIPLASIIHFERRSGKDKPVIEKALVETSSPAFQYFQSRRDEWAFADKFCSPGPIQFWGPVANQLPMTVALNTGYDFRSFDLGKEMPFFSEYDCKIFKFQDFCKQHGLLFNEEGLFENNDILNYQVTTRYRLSLGNMIFNPGSTLVINEFGEVFHMVQTQLPRKKSDS
jgi:diphosphate-dependent phosphofructokinase